AVEVLGGRVHDDVGTVLERALQHRRGEGVVGHDQQAVLPGDRADRLQVDDLQGRVGRGFDPHQLRPRRDRGLEGGRVGQVDEAEVQPGAAPAHALEQAVGATVDVVHGDHVVAAVEQV